MVGAALALLVAGLIACGSDDDNQSEDRVVGAGSTAQEVAQKAWVTEFNLARPGKKISYEPVGSSTGLDRFIGGEAAFAASDTPLAGGELEDAVSRCKPGRLIEVPAYISAVVVVYNLKNTGIDLTPAMLARIFKGEVAYWDDPAIRRENSSISSIGLPHVRVSPVHRPGGSGTTENFTDYLSQATPAAWPYPAGDSWPVKGGEEAASTVETIGDVYKRVGRVGYVDMSQASELGQVAPKVGREYVGPSVESVEKAFGEASEAKALAKSPYMFPFALDRKTDSPGAYPLALVSYLIACTKYDSAEEAVVIEEYLEYVTGAEGQELAAEEAGSAPLPAALRKRIRPAIAAID